MNLDNRTLFTAIAIAAAVAVAACGRGSAGDRPAIDEPAPAVRRVGADHGAPPLRDHAANHGDDDTFEDHDHDAHPVAAPEDGKPLFDFLLTQIPGLVNKVPCSCCPFMIGDCYRGACPKTCGPCNAIGRKVYRWHLEGVPDDVIVARVKLEHPRKPMD